MNCFCDMCRRRRTVPGVGPLPCRWLFLGEGPGWEENKYLEPFVGKSGRELNGLYLPMSGLGRHEIRIENALQCFHEDPDQDLVDCCAHKHLPDIIAKCNPEVIITLGAMALSQFGDWPLELVHGFPIPNVTYQLHWGETWTGTVFPCYHPAAGLHQSQFMIQIEEDFRNLWLYRHGQLRVPVDEHPNPDYRLLSTRDEVRQVIRSATDRLGPNTYTWKAGTDTEYIGKRVWCQTVSLLPGTGYMIMADNQEARDEFLSWARSADVLWLFWNWLADAPMVRQMGMDWDYRWRDGMVNSYHLGFTPQGLKAACYRLCGMTMQDFDDLVYPYARADAVRWLVNVASNPVQEYIDSLPWKQKSASCSGGGNEDPDYPAIRPVITKAKKSGITTHKYPKHQSCPTYFDAPGTIPCIICGKPKSSGEMERDKSGSRFLWDVAAQIVKSMDESPKTNPFKRWHPWRVRLQEQADLIESRFGPMPKPTIDRAYKADPEATIRYACRDADATLRGIPKLRLLGKKVEKENRKGETYAIR